MNTKQTIKQNQLVWIFKSDLGDSTLGGVTSKATKTILQWGEGEDVEEEDYPVLQLVERTIGSEKYLHAEPVNPKKTGLSMAGGNFVYSSDSRFPSNQPISVHDRIETQAEYNMYSA
jgi:hypothetical protein